MAKISANCLVKNEERWIWFAIQSVIEYVDEILIWDTGSTDMTVSAIKSFKNPKIRFKQVGEVSEYEYPQVRQRMLEESHNDWILTLDGDEIWPGKSVSELAKTISEVGNQYDFFIRPTISLLGDVYHFQEEAGGQYTLRGLHGHFTIRTFKKAIPGLHYEKPHGQLGLFDSSGQLIQDNPERASLFLDLPILHTTHLRRSSDRHHDQVVMKRRLKYKYELGINFPRDYNYPEVFYLPRPAFISSPWYRRSLWYVMNALWQTPLKLAKRRLIRSQKTGY